eukprot:3747640-Prorocentrum_lima.AAC.1
MGKGMREGKADRMRKQTGKDERKQHGRTLVLEATSGRALGVRKVGGRPAAERFGLGPEALQLVRQADISP